MITADIIAKGRFKLLKTHSGKVVEETPFTKNLIVRTGLIQMLSNNGNASLSAVVGSGNRLPSLFDTAMESEVVAANAIVTTDVYRDFLPDEFGRLSWRVIHRFRYAEGVFGAGTVILREVGVKTSAALISRARLSDAYGNPIQLTLDAATEGVDVVWEFTEYVPALSIASLLATYHQADGAVLSTSTHQITIMPANFTSSGIPPEGWLEVDAGKLTSALFDVAHISIGNGTLGTVIAEPTLVESVPPDSLSVLYPSGAARAVISMGLGLDVANFISGIDCMSLKFGHTQWQLSIDPPIYKLDTQELALQFSIQMENE